MRTLTKGIILLWLALHAAASTAAAVQVHGVTRDGRSIQLDGFLLEWTRANAFPLDKDSLWLCDVLNTRDGLTGYFASGKPAGCGLWKFRFLPHRLSPYSFMELHASLDSTRFFYKTAPLAGAPGKGIAAEWVIPWDSIWHDSAGAYQVGLLAFDTCGDTMQPLIFTGRVYYPKPPMWGGVYLKGILLGAMMIVLFYLQRRVRSRKKSARRRGKGGVAIDG